MVAFVGDGVARVSDRAICLVRAGLGTVRSAGKRATQVALFTAFARVRANITEPGRIRARGPTNPRCLIAYHARAARRIRTTRSRGKPAESTGAYLAIGTIRVGGANIYTDSTGWRIRRTNLPLGTLVASGAAAFGGDTSLAVTYFTFCAIHEGCTLDTRTLPSRIFFSGATIKGQG